MTEKPLKNAFFANLFACLAWSSKEIQAALPDDINKKLSRWYDLSEEGFNNPEIDKIIREVLPKIKKIDNDDKEFKKFIEGLEASLRMKVAE